MYVSVHVSLTGSLYRYPDLESIDAYGLEVTAAGLGLIRLHSLPLRAWTQGPAGLDERNATNHGMKADGRGSRRVASWGEPHAGHDGGGIGMVVPPSLSRGLRPLPF